jgi:hypothetical protein
MPDFVIKPTLQTIVDEAVCVNVVPEGEHNAYSVYEVTCADRMDRWVADFGERPAAEHYVNSVHAAAALKRIIDACDRPTRGPRAYIDFTVAIKKAIESARSMCAAIDA